VKARLNAVSAIRVLGLGLLCGGVALAVCMGAGVQWAGAGRAGLCGWFLGGLAAAGSTWLRGGWANVTDAARWLDRRAGTSDGFVTVMGLGKGTGDRAAVQGWLRRRLAEVGGQGQLPVPEWPWRWLAVVSCTTVLTVLGGLVVGSVVGAVRAGEGARDEARSREGLTAFTELQVGTIAPPPPGPSEGGGGEPPTPGTRADDQPVGHAQGRVGGAIHSSGAGAAAGPVASRPVLSPVETKRPQLANADAPGSPRQAQEGASGQQGGGHDEKLARPRNTGPVSGNTPKAGRSTPPVPDLQPPEPSAERSRFEVPDYKHWAESRTTGLNPDERRLLQRYFGW
jgi:hypothetical protein